MKSGEARHQAGPGQSVHLLYSLQRGALAPANAQAEVPKQQRTWGSTVFVKESHFLIPLSGPKQCVIVDAAK